MRHAFISHLSIAALVSLALVACDNKNESEPPAPSASAPVPSAATPAMPVHAAQGVEPGSHEDWCGEHQVPESLCTRCNPSLIAAFKATGDWCEEHGLPESQCLLCNPNLKIERPPRSAEKSP